MDLPISTFGQDGVDVNNPSRSMTYLYGLSDFFHFIFQDTDIPNLMLEANALTSSEIYSKFLQLTSTLSIQSIQNTLGVSIKLIFLTEADRVGTLPIYNIDSTIVSSRFLTNRPFLPTETLESDVDFVINQTTSGTTIQFAETLDTYQFSQRILSSGLTQYAIWMADAVIDDRLMSTYYGNLLGFEPQNSTQQFTDFIYGLYYLFTSGPTMDVMEKGANLVLGVPLARGGETVVDIRNYLNTDQYLVITESNQYLLPTGIAAIVSIGDTLSTGQLIAKVVELKDYESDGEWWINVSIPSNIIPKLPPSQSDRFAKLGTVYYQMMSQYLKRHTFLIRINVGAFTNVEFFSTVFDTLTKARPSYTQAIYTWFVDVGSDDGGFVIDDSTLVITQPTGVPLREINTFEINAKEIN